MEEIFAYLLTYRFLVYILIVTFFLGVQFFEKVPHVLYYSFLSIMNIASGVFLFLEIKFLGNIQESDISSLLFGFFAILLLSMSLVGGYLTTKRQLKLFQKINK